MTRQTKSNSILRKAYMRKMAKENKARHVQESAQKAAAAKPKGKAAKPAVTVKLKGSASDKKRITGMVDRLAESPKGKALLETGKDAGFTFYMAKGIGIYGGADPEKKTVVLNADYGDDLLLGTLAHELRHVSQYQAGVEPDIEKLDTKSYLMQNRAMEADAEANAVAACWELNQKGDTGPWDTYTKQAPHITGPFEKNAAKDPELKSNVADKAMTAAFKGWYTNKGLIDTYDSFQADDLEFIEEYDFCTFNTKLSAKKIVDSVCRKDKGGTYLTVKPSALESNALLAMSSKNKKRFENVFDEYLADEWGLSDTSFKDIPTRADARQAPKRKTSSKLSALSTKPELKLSGNKYGHELKTDGLLQNLHKDSEQEAAQKQKLAALAMRKTGQRV